MDAPSGSRRGMRYLILMTCLTLVPAQQQPPATTTTSSAEPINSSSVDCFTSSSVVGAVLGTFFATSIVLGSIFFILWWIYCRRRRSSLSDGQDKSAHAAESGPGFDNPCFEAHPQSDVVDGSKRDEDGRKQDVTKSTSWTPLRFFGNSRAESKKRSMDDSFISEPERVSVQLRGHDFTGLGFNVTGNMRDGIFIKDILNRGPAFESGKIGQGDRILSVTISFRHVVYEDALTILSYASPYDVTMELEKGQRNNSNTLKQRKAASTVSLTVSSTTSSATASGSVSPDSAPVNERLIHPLYRSQSIDDLSKVGRADTAIRADVRIPTLSGNLGGGSLVKSKLLTKANVEADLPSLPDVKIKTGSVSKPAASVVVDTGDISIAPAISAEPKASKFSKFGIKVLPDFKFKTSSSKNSDLTLTNLPTGLTTPEVELNLPKVEIHTPKSSNVAIDIDMPDGALPSLPSGDASVSIDMPEVVAPSAAGVDVSCPDVSLDIDAPLMSLSSDISGPELGITTPKISSPKVDVALPSAKANLEVDLPDVALSQKIPDAELNLDAAKADVKSGFHLKFPKFGGNKVVKVDVPETELTVAAPAIDVSLPEASLELDPKLKKEGASAKGGFEFKMPKLSMKKPKTDIAVDVKGELPHASIEIPEVGAGVEGASIEVNPPVLEASIPSAELPSLTVESKKSKSGFSMPKWNLGKGQVDIKEPSAEVSIEAPTVQVDVPQVSLLSDDEEAEGGKKKSKFSLKLPKMSKTGKADVEVALPKISAEVSHGETDDDDDDDKKKAKKISLKLPKVPKAELGVDVSLPSVEAKEESDVDGSSKKKTSKFGLKMPKFSREEVDVNVVLPKVSAEVKHDESSSDEEDHSAVTAKKKSSKFGFRKPKTSVKGEVDVNLALPSASIDAHTEEMPKGEVDVNVTLPKVSAEVKGSETDDDGTTKKKSSKFNLKMPKMPKGEVDVNVGLPKVSAELKSPTSDDSDDEGASSKKKAGGKFSLKMPKMPKGEVDVNVAVPKVETSKQEGESDDEGVAGKKKSSKFSLKMPKWNVNKPHSEIAAFEGVEGKIQIGADMESLTLPSAEMRMSDIGSDFSDDEGTKKRGKFSIKMPKFGMNKPQVQVETGDVTADVDLPKAQAEAHVELDAGKIEGKKKTKFGFKMPKIGGAAAPADVNLQLEGAKEVAVELPTVDVKVEAESSSEDEAGEAEEKKKKRFHLKMPKFGTSKAHVEVDLPQVDAAVDLPDVKPVETNVEMDVSAPKLSVDLSGATASHRIDSDSDDDDETKKKKKFHLKMPDFGLNTPRADVDVKLRGGASKTGEDSSSDDENQPEKKIGLKMPKFGLGLGGKVHGDIEPVEVEANIKGDVKVDVDEPKERKKGTKFGIKLPGLHFDKPHAEASGNVRHSDADSSSDEDGEAKGKSKMSLKMPKFGLSKPNVEAELKVEGPTVDLPDVKLEGELEAPKLNVDLEPSDGEIGDESKKKHGKFGIKLPKFNVSKSHAAAESTKSEISVDVPKVDLKAPKLEVEATAPKLDIDVKGPKLDVDVKGPKVDLGGDVSDGEGDEKKKKHSKFGLKMPKFHGKKKTSNVDLGINKEAALQLEIEGAAVAVDADSESSDDETRGKKKTKFGLKMPKLELKKPQVEIELPTGKDVSVEGEVNMPSASINMPSLEIGNKNDDEPILTSVSLPKFEIKKPEIVTFIPTLSAGEDVSVEGEINMPSASIDLPSLEIGKKDEDESILTSVSLPKFTIKKPEIVTFIPTLSAGEDVSVEGEINMPTASIDLPSLEIGKKDEDEPILTSVTLPKFEIKKPEIVTFIPDIKADELPELDAEIKAPSLDIETPHVSVDVGEMKMKRPSVDLTVGGGLPDVTHDEVDLSANIDLPTLPSVEIEGLKKKSKFGIDMGKLGFKKPSIDVKASGDIEPPKVPDVNVTGDVSLGANVDLPKAEVDVDLDDDKKKSSKFSFKMPKFHMGKHHGEVKMDPKLELPEVGAEANIEAPSLEVEVPHVAVDIHGDAESDDEKKDKKKSHRFGIKMPKFHMNKPHAPDVEVKTDDVHLDVKCDLPTVEANVPEITLEQGGIDVNLAKASVDPIEIQMPEAKIDIHEKEIGKKKGKFSFKMPKLHGSSKAEVEIPDIDTNIELPKVEIPEADMKVELSGKETAKKSPFIVKMPELDLSKPGLDVDLPKAKLDVDSSSEDSQSDDDDKGKKKLKLGMKMPHLSLTGKGGVDVEAPSVSAEAAVPSVELPSAKASVSVPNVPDVTVDVKKKSKFGFKMPSLPHGKAHVEVSGPEVTDISLDPAIGVEVHGKQHDADSESSDDETGKKSTHKAGVKIPKFKLRQRGADVVLPQVELQAEDLLEGDVEIETPKEAKVAIKKPKFGIKLPAMPELHKPKVEAKVELPQVEAGALNVELEVPRPELEIQKPNMGIDVPTVGDNFNASAQVQAVDIPSGQATKKDDDTSSSSDSEDEKKSKPSGFHLGLKMPKFSLGKEKHSVETKLDVDTPTVTMTNRNNGDDVTSPSLSSLETEPVKLESVSEKDKEKKKFNIGLKMPKFQSKTAAATVEGDASMEAGTVDNAEHKAFKINLKAPKVTKEKKKKKEDSTPSDDSDDDGVKNERELSVAASSKLMEAEVKLPRVQVYKNVEYHDAEKEHHQQSSSDEDEEVKDIKKNIGARFGVKLKKPKMFSSSKVEISGKNDPTVGSGSSSAALQPEWKLPRVDLRRTSKPTAEQELTVDVDLDVANEQQKLEQLSPSERTEAIRRDSKSSAGIRLHSPSYISQMMPSPRSKKSSLELLDVESSPRLLSVTRLDPTPPIETSATTQPVYGGVQLTASVTAPQVSVSDIPSSVLMASDAVKIKRGPPTPARRSIIDPNSPIFSVPASVVQSSEVSVPPAISAEVTIPTPVIEPAVTASEDASYAIGQQTQQTSDTDISVTTSTGSDTLVIACGPVIATAQQEASNRKASSLGDLTRIPPSTNDDGSLERTVSLDFKPVPTLGGSSRAIYNLAVHDLSRVGEDSDEDYSLSRKRSNYDDLGVEVSDNSPDDITDIQVSSPSDFAGHISATSETLDSVNDTDAGNVNMKQFDSDNAESLWFGSTSIQTVESVQTTMSYTQLEESVSTDVTLTTTSLGTSPSETSSSSSDDSPTSPASPEPSNESTPDLILQVENGNMQQYHQTEITEITQEEIVVTTSRSVTMEVTSSSDDPQPQPLTELNPSAGNFAAVRSRFEQLSGNINGGETTLSPSSARNSGRLNQGAVKRLSGNFEDPSILQKSFVQHMAPEVSEGALSRTVIISSLQLERSEENSSTVPASVGPESPVPNLEPPC